MIKTIVNPSRETWKQLTSRQKSDDQAVASRVKEIIDLVKEKGDDALFELTKSIDRIDLDCLRVSDLEMENARLSLAPALKEAMSVAAENIKKFHAAQKKEPIKLETSPGVICEQKSIAIERVGLYIPGGTAPLLSTVLMLALPAQVAGCKEICLCSPVQANGAIAPEVLYAAQLCGVNEIYKVGGAQAIAAMAYGTIQIKAVHKIFGPGNRYVTYAKQLVSVDAVAIDMPAGPSEVMVLADSSANPTFVAADLLSQAEHGTDSQAIALTTSTLIAAKIRQEVSCQVETLSRKETAIEALKNSAIIVLENTQDLIDMANMYGAEHLIISMKEPEAIAEQITAAGSIFLGNFTPESAGDYASGTNHTLPTSGWAKSYSGVNLDSFVKKITIQQITKQGLQQLAPTLTVMALSEGLDAHANAVKVRLENL